MKAFQDYYPQNVAHCYGCGSLNAHGHQIKTYWDGDETVTRFAPEPYHTSVPGFAYGGLRQHGEDNFPPLAIYQSSNTVTGYVLGGGLEYKFNPAWSLKAEYQYLDFGKHDVPISSGAAPSTIQADGSKLTDDAFHTVRIGLNYWVSPAYEPLK